jgi:hypothetical protein
MAGQMWMIPAQRASLHEDAANLLPRLGGVACPVLLIEGAASPPVIGQILDRLEAGLADVRRARIEARGTWCRSPMPTRSETLGDVLRHGEAGAGKRAFSV